MIHRLEMEGYRGFPRYTLANLSRVNLLVGKNNSGKSSILEAVQLLADGGDFRTLDQIARRRGETVTLPSESGIPASSRLAEVSHFFHGHSVGPGSQFLLRSDSEFGARRFHIGAVGDEPDVVLSDFALDPGILTPEDMLLLSVEEEEGRRHAWEPKSKKMVLSEGGAMRFRRSLLKHVGGVSPGRQDALPSLFIPPDSLDRAQLGRMWDRIITEGAEEDVVRAMQLLEPDLTSIAFLSGDAPGSSDPRGGVLVGFRGESQRRPLGSYGEGMRRLLTLAVVLQRTKNGVLLIDEVDTGLHYSILGDVWSLIVETAVRNNVQVFLTTHSLDCLRALGWFCGARPDLADQVSVQKIERRLDEAVALDASQIQIAVEQDIEVR